MVAPILNQDNGQIPGTESGSSYDMLNSAYEKGVSAYQTLLSQANKNNTANYSSEQQAPEARAGISEQVLSDIEERRRVAREELNKMTENPAIDPLTYSQYYPNSQKPLSAGTYQGSTFSAPIFTPSFVSPMARKDAVAKAKYDQQTAAMEARLATEVDFELDPLTNKFFSEDLNDKYYSELDGMIKDFSKTYGDDWEAELMRSPRFKALNRNFNAVVGGLNQASATLADIEAREKMGEIILTPSQRKLVRDFNAGNIGGTGDITEMDNVTKMIREINGVASLQNVLTSGGYKDAIKASVDTAIGKMMNEKGVEIGGSDYDLWETTMTASFDEAAEAVAEELANTIYSDSDLYTKEYIKNYITSTYGRTVKKEFQQIWNSRNTGGGNWWNRQDYTSQQEQERTARMYELAREAQEGGALTGIQGGSIGGKPISNASRVEFVMEESYKDNTPAARTARALALSSATGGVQLHKIKNYPSINWEQASGKFILLQTSDGYYIWDTQSPDFLGNYVTAINQGFASRNQQDANVYFPDGNNSNYPQPDPNTAGNSNTNDYVNTEAD